MYRGDNRFVSVSVTVCVFDCARESSCVSQTSQPGNRPGREKPTPSSMHIQFCKKMLKNA